MFFLLLLMLVFLTAVSPATVVCVASVASTAIVVFVVAVVAANTVVVATPTAPVAVAATTSDTPPVTVVIVATTVLSVNISFSLLPLLFLPDSKVFPSEPYKIAAVHFFFSWLLSEEPMFPRTSDLAYTAYAEAYLHEVLTRVKDLQVHTPARYLGDKILFLHNFFF